MYAKVLNDGGPLPIPMLLMTVGEDVPLIDEVLTRGWKPYAGDVLEDNGTEIRIMPDHLSIAIDEEVLFHDPHGDPVSPPGWWEAVSAFGDRALVVLLPHDFPMTTDAAGDALAALVDSPTTAQAFAKIVHA